MTNREKALIDAAVAHCTNSIGENLYSAVHKYLASQPKPEMVICENAGECKSIPCIHMVSHLRRVACSDYCVCYKGVSGECIPVADKPKEIEEIEKLEGDYRTRFDGPPLLVNIQKKINELVRMVNLLKGKSI